MSGSVVVNLLAYGYLLIALVFLTLTWAEGWHSRAGWTFYRVLGLALCCVWPLLLLIVLIAVSRQRRRLPF